MVTVVNSSYERSSTVESLDAVGVIGPELVASSIKLIVAALWVLWVNSTIKDKVVEFLTLNISLIVGIFTTDHGSDIGAALDSLISEVCEHFFRIGEVVEVDSEGLIFVLNIDINVQSVQRNPVFSVFVHCPLDINSSFVTIASLVVA